jgi:hypothetical protein
VETLIGRPSLLWHVRGLSVLNDEPGRGLMSFVEYELSQLGLTYQKGS